jgi:hypothetical protein
MATDKFIEESPFSSSPLIWIKLSTSGWSSNMIAIIAARRALPPDLTTSAVAAVLRMKAKGPLELSPDDSGHWFRSR